MIRKIAFALLCFALSTVAALASDFNGKWTATIDTPIGVQNYTYEFHVDGAKLTGTFQSDRGSGEIQQGKIVGDTITFTADQAGGQGTLHMEYTGKINGDVINFSRKVGDYGTNEFVAKRAK